jgi:hypothetical protein
LKKMDPATKGGLMEKARELRADLNRL